MPPPPPPRAFPHRLSVSCPGCSHVISFGTDDDNNDDNNNDNKSKIKPDVADKIKIKDKSK